MPDSQLCPNVLLECVARSRRAPCWTPTGAREPLAANDPRAMGSGRGRFIARGCSRRSDAEGARAEVGKQCRPLHSHARRRPNWRKWLDPLPRRRCASNAGWNCWKRNCRRNVLPKCAQPDTGHGHAAAAQCGPGARRPSHSCAHEDDAADQARKRRRKRSTSNRWAGCKCRRRRRRCMARMAATNAATIDFHSQSAARARNGESATKPRQRQRKCKSCCGEAAQTGAPAARLAAQHPFPSHRRPHDASNGRSAELRRTLEPK
mmetsp:Transcript_36792/g.101186  ORF Transcript_36792/g.101186 Transcript_36792/m.101186 type:complete len:263 (-) Transcript_36792:24-812(-)